MNEKIKYLEAILQERLKGEDTRLVISFEGITIPEDVKKYKQDFYYESEMRAGIPETCAVQIYIGKGQTPDEAFEDMANKVLQNEPIKTELG